MNISANDLNQIDAELGQEVRKGNEWVVYEAGLFYVKFDNAKYFKDGGDALQYITDNTADAYDFDLLPTRGLHNAIQELINTDSKRQDIDFYVIDNSSFEVSRSLKVNVDQNPLHDPDGNEFTDAMIEHLESQAQSDNFKQLKGDLSDLGYEPDYFLTLESSMKKGAPNHTEQSFDELGGELVKFDHLFTKNSAGLYSLEKITGTLYTYIDIDDATIKGVNTADLQEAMMSLNWDYDGYGFMKEHEKLFLELAEDPYGRLIIAQLYNNNADPWFDKPDFISAIEDELKIYPKMDFPGNITAAEVYEGLKTYQKISVALSKYSIPEVTDAASKSAMIEQLVNRQHCTISSPWGLKNGDDVTINWDAQGQKLSFIHQGQDVKQFFEKKQSAQFALIAKELEQFPFQQIENPTKKELLVEALLDGHKRAVHLEKSIVPAEHIDKYIVVERQYPTDDGQYFKPVELFNQENLDTAIKEMRLMGDNFNFDVSKSDFVLMVIGQYKGKTIEYDKEEMPTINSGYRIALSYGFSPDGNSFTYIQPSVEAKNVLVDQIFVEMDSGSSKLNFSNKFGELIEIDRKFWIPKEEISLDKNQSTNAGDLLPKLRSSGDKGLKM